MGKWLIGLAATIIGGVVVGVVVWWLTSPGGVLNPAALPAPPPAVGAGGATGGPLGAASTRPETHQTQAAAQGLAGSGVTDSSKPHPSGPRERLTQSLLLHDGAQAPIVNGQASVGVDFTRVGEIDVATVHVNAPGKDVTNHAIMSAGERFEIAVAGRSYYLYVAGIDTEARTLRLRIEERR